MVGSNGWSAHVDVRRLHERHVDHAGLGECDALLGEVERPVETARHVEEAAIVVERRVVLGAVCNGCNGCNGCMM